VLSELAEKIDPAKLAAAASSAPVPWVQRLGFLLDLVGAGNMTGPLKDFVRRRARESAPLLANAPRASLVSGHSRARRRTLHRDEAWKLYVNAEVAPEL
jgi:hypothetical protein